MKKQLCHNKIGVCNIIIQAEFKRESGNQYFYLVSSFFHPDKKSKSFVFRPIWSKKSPTYYYILWGNKTDPNELGITPLLTDALKPTTLKKSMEIFMKMISAGEFVEFNQIKK